MTFVKSWITFQLSHVGVAYMHRKGLSRRTGAAKMPTFFFNESEKNEVKKCKSEM